MVIGAVALAAYRYVCLTESIDLGVDADLPRMRMLEATLRVEGLTDELSEPDGDDPLGGVIDVK